MKDFSRYIKLNPKDPDAYYWRARGAPTNASAKPKKPKPMIESPKRSRLTPKGFQLNRIGASINPRLSLLSYQLLL